MKFVRVVLMPRQLAFHVARLCGHKMYGIATYVRR